MGGLHTSFAKFVLSNIITVANNYIEIHLNNGLEVWVGSGYLTGSKGKFSMVLDFFFILSQLPGWDSALPSPRQPYLIFLALLYFFF